MQALSKSVNKRFIGCYRQSRDGSILIETALVVTMLVTLAVGILDFGLAYLRKSEMDNAVRAGVQFGLARHPSIGEITDGVVTAQDVRDAVLESASFLETDPGDPLQISFTCECPDGTAVQCTSTAIATLPCSDRRTYLQVRLEHDYSMLFPYPGLGQTLSMVSENAIRLN